MNRPTHDQDILTPAEQIEMAVSLVAAFVSKNSADAGELPELLRSVHSTIVGLGQPVAEVEPLVPAVNVKRSVTDQHIVSLIDGKSYKSLKRHIGTHGFTPQSYRAAYGLPADYPMVAPAYAAVRSQLAKSLGLGRKPVAQAA